MDISQQSPLIRVSFALVAVLTLYALFTSLTLWRRRQALQREKGTLPAPRYPQKDRILGLDVFNINMKAIKEHRFLALTLQRFKTMGTNTFQMVALGRKLVVTTEPENLKAMQAVDFKKWGLGRRRKDGFKPLLGAGRWPFYHLLFFQSRGFMTVLTLLRNFQGSSPLMAQNGNIPVKCSGPILCARKSATSVLWTLMSPTC